MPLLSSPPEVLYSEARAGSPDAFGLLVGELYAELRAIASGQRRRLRASDTLHTTALVHEAYLKLHGGRTPRALVDRAHFYRVAARVMHDVLVDYARARHTQKRGSGQRAIDLSEAGVAIPATRGNLADILTVDDALRQLARVDAEAAQVVQLRYFGGLTNEETAEAMSMSLATIKRRWIVARAYLLSRLKDRPAMAA